MNSYKVVFFLPSDVEGRSMVKKIFQDKFNLPQRNSGSLVFDYISYTVDMITVNWKIYLVSEMDKFEEIRPIYFRNVHTYVMVLDLANFGPVWEKFLEAIKLHRVDSKIVCLGYSRKNECNTYMGDVVRKENGMYFEFSERTDLEGIIEYLFEGEHGLKSQDTPLC